MRSERQDESSGGNVIYQSTCWCWPNTRFGSYFWGVLLLLGGAIWLLHNVGLIPLSALETFWPLALIGLGAAYLLRPTDGQRIWPRI